MSAAVSLFRVFDPDPTQTDAADYSSLKLRAAFETLHWPELENPARGTLYNYRSALNHWERRTSDPPVGEVTDETLAAFKRSLISDGLAASTVGKAWRTLAPIFQTLVRKRVLAGVPRVKLPRVELGEPRVASNRELSALYDACSCVRVYRGPCRGSRGAALFRAALVLVFNTGLRREDLWRITWDGVDLERRTITVKLRKTRRTITRPLTRATVNHLRGLRALYGGPVAEQGGRVFPLSASAVQTAWDAIRARAGIRDITWHDLRRTCQTRLDEIAMGVGDWMLDHKAKDVGGLYYRNMRRLGRRTLARVKQPKAFRTVPKDPQKRLFAEEQNGTDIREDTTEGGTEAGREGQA